LLRRNRGICRSEKAVLGACSVKGGHPVISKEQEA
jgi:hypothetical protein